MPRFAVTRLLIVVLTARFAADLLSLRDLLWTSSQGDLPLSFTGPIIARWGLHEFPQTLEYVATIIMVEGLYRVWRNMRRLRPVASEVAG